MQLHSNFCMLIFKFKAKMLQAMIPLEYTVTQCVKAL